MENIDLTKLSPVLTDEMITTILSIGDPDSIEWIRMIQQLSNEQQHQLYFAREDARRKKHEEWLKTASQKEIDSLKIAGLIHGARDHYFVTIFDEYDIVNGKGYYPYLSLDQIKVSSPINYAYKAIELRRNYMKEDEKFTAFDCNSPLAMNYHSKFIVDGLEFSSSLHYVIYKKAEFLIDREKMTEILMTIDQHGILQLGRELWFFDKQVWNMQIKVYLLTGIREKFLQNPELMKELKASRGTTLVLADGYDKKWGAGLAIGSADLLIRKTWPGKNLLGELLTEIRTEFVGEY